MEETLNTLLDKEADELVHAEKYERSSERLGYRSEHYKRNLHTTAGEVELKVPKLKGISFETAIIERYRRRESSVEEAPAPAPAATPDAANGANPGAAAQTPPSPTPVSSEGGVSPEASE